LEQEKYKIIDIVNKEIDQKNGNSAKLIEGICFWEDFSLYNLRELGLYNDDKHILMNEYEFSKIMSNYTN
jgi:hypothetical protein